MAAKLNNKIRSTGDSAAQWSVARVKSNSSDTIWEWKAYKRRVTFRSKETQGKWFIQNCTKEIFIHLWEPMDSLSYYCSKMHLVTVLNCAVEGLKMVIKANKLDEPQ